MRFLIIAILLITTCLQGQDLPTSSQRALAVLDRDIASARAKVIKALEADLQKVMRTGDLDTANALNAEIENQKKLMPVPEAAVAPLMTRMAGRRLIVDRPADVWVFYADGTLDSPPFFTGGGGTWEFDAKAKKIHITTPRWSKTLDWQSEDVWLEDGRRTWTLEK